MSEHKACAFNTESDASPEQRLSEVENELLILFRQLSPVDQGCVQRVAKVLCLGIKEARRERSRTQEPA